MPMLSFGQQNLAGIGELKYNWYPSRVFRKIDLGYQAKSFSFDLPVSENNVKWTKSAVQLNFEVYNKKLRTAPIQQFHLNLISLSQLIENNTNLYSNYFNFSYELKSKQPLKPSALKLDYIVGNDNLDQKVNTISITAKKRWNYNLKLDGIEFRLFAGKSLYENTNSKYNWRMSGQTGLYDYLFDNTYLGRTATSPNFLSQQLGDSHGGFKTYTNTGSSNNWLISLNTKLDIPKLPFGLFADIAYYPYKENNQGVIRDKVGSNFDLGLWIPIKKDFIEVYVPLFFSEKIKQELAYNDINFWQRISFVIHFNSMNPFKLISEIKP